MGGFETCQSRGSGSDNSVSEKSRRICRGVSRGVRERETRGERAPSTRATALALPFPVDERLPDLEPLKWEVIFSLPMLLTAGCRACHTSSVALELVEPEVEQFDRQVGS